MSPNKKWKFGSMENEAFSQFVWPWPLTYDLLQGQRSGPLTFFFVKGPKNVLFLLSLIGAE